MEIRDLNLQYCYANGAVYNNDCFDFLSALPGESADMVFADPPYNIKKASWDDLGTQDEYIEWPVEWLREAARVLKQTGTLYVCGFTEIVADLRRPAMEFFKKCKWLIWYYDNKANMGNDWGRSHESIICLRKSSKYTFNVDQIRVGSPIHHNIQAEIVSRREQSYHFFQFRDDGHYCVTRPVNSELLIPSREFQEKSSAFLKDLQDIQAIKGHPMKRDNINRAVYSCQQAVGCVLDSMNNANKAKKRNGDHFERLIRSIVAKVGIENERQVQSIELSDGETIRFEHDIVLKSNDKITAIGQLKTSSKGRLDKIFLDKFLYQRLLKTDIPYFAIFLNDVQRTKARDGSYCVGLAFLPGHFKAYSIAIDPLDGVYYFDLHPKIGTDDFLAKHIFPFDWFLTDDVWSWIPSQQGR